MDEKAEHRMQGKLEKLESEKVERPKVRYTHWESRWEPVGQRGQEQG